MSCMGERNWLAQRSASPQGLIAYPGKIFRVDRGQQAMFALVDAFAKAILTCVPEPPPDATQQAITRAKERYERLVKAAGQAMSGDTRAAIQDLGETMARIDEEGSSALSAKAPRAPERRCSVVERIQAAHAFCPQQPKAWQPHAGRKRKKLPSTLPALRSAG